MGTRGNAKKFARIGDSLDRIEEALGKDWEKGDGWYSKDDIPHFGRKIGILEKSRDLLLAHGARTLAQLRAAESPVPDYGDEVRRLQAFCRQG